MTTGETAGGLLGWDLHPLEEDEALKAYEACIKSTQAATAAASAAATSTADSAAVHVHASTAHAIKGHAQQPPVRRCAR